ncbi:MAG: 30S ribosomal protein S20 [Candidatus Krumholzibacteria bacterium]|nr:30S ribosomal protein S20 [Candidatus Krumholzibacteria bacterium]
MPNNKSTEKRMRQNETRRLRNRVHRSGLRKAIKAFKAIEDTETVRNSYPGIVSVIDKTVRKGIIHHRTAARLKSRLSRVTKES